MTCRIANHKAFSSKVQPPVEPVIVRDYDKQPLGKRARLLIACALTAVMALLAVVLWLDGTQWRKLLLFGAIVAIAALGGSRAAPVAASRHREDGIVRRPEKPAA